MAKVGRGLARSVVTHIGSQIPHVHLCFFDVGSRVGRGSSEEFSLVVCWQCGALSGQLCFQCATRESSPPGAPVTNIDWEAMKKLFEELNVPVLKKDEGYTKLYEESMSKG